MRVQEWQSASLGIPEGLDALVDAARDVDGHKPLGEHALAELKAGPQELPHAAYVAFDDGHLIGYAHVSYRQTRNGWRLEFVTHPAARGRGVATALVQRVVERVERDGGGVLHTWGPDDGDVARTRLIDRFGMRPVRRLHQQHAPLPVPPSPMPASVIVHGFDEALLPTWLALHNRVFAKHPDAAGWTEADVRWRMREPWFDAGGVRMAVRGDRLLGYHWVKLHEHEDAAHDIHDSDSRIVAEVYMLGVDQDARGTGLAAALTAEGLDWGRDRGATRGMLYVDEDNAPAMRLYASLGFTTSHVDVCYELDVPSDPET